MQTVLYRALALICLLLSIDAGYAQKRARIDRSNTQSTTQSATTKKKKAPAVKTTAKPAAKPASKPASRSKSVPAPQLSLSTYSINTTASGGTYNINVTSNCNWSVSINPYSWGHLTRSGNSLIYRIDSNSSYDSRTDYIEVKAVNANGTAKTCRVNVRQAASARAAEPYINVSPSSLSFSASSGTRTLSVDANYDWHISVGTASWADLTRNGDRLTLTVRENTSTDERTDYFKLKATSPSGQVVEKRIDFSQDGKLRSATIDRVWVDHNVYYNGNNSMRIHSKVEVNGCKDEKVYYCVAFFKSDNVTPLHTPRGNDIVYSFEMKPTYEGSIWNDWWVTVPYNGLNMAPGFHYLSFDVIIKDSNGNVLTRKNNNTFTYSR